MPGNIDLRQEIYKIFRGGDGIKGIGQLIIHRKVRMDDNGDYIRCICYDKVSGDHGIDNCPYCHGLGYLFDERLVIGYITDKIPTINDKLLFNILPGETGQGKHYAILEYWVEPSEKDMLLEPIYNTNVSGTQNVKIYRKWYITSAAPIRGDYGRTEYWVCTIEYYNKKIRGNYD